MKDKDELDLLIDILFDPTAREDERYDAAMYIARFNSEKALDALLILGSNPHEDDIILDACGESITSIMVKREEFRKDIINKLRPIAKHTAYDFITAHEPQWIKNYNFYRE